MLTSRSVDKPKSTLAIIFVVILALSSGASQLVFDNTEDGFFPDNETVALLNEIEDEYQASVDFNAKNLAINNRFLNGEFHPSKATSIANKQRADKNQKRCGTIRDIANKNAKKFPHIPERGNLDLSLVKQSIFFCV